MTKDLVLSTRIGRELKQDLASIASATERPIGWHVEKAIAQYVELNRWQIAAIQEGIDDAEAGRLGDADHVESWARARLRKRLAPTFGVRGRAKRDSRTSES